MDFKNIELNNESLGFLLKEEIDKLFKYMDIASTNNCVSLDHKDLLCKIAELNEQFRSAIVDSINNGNDLSRFSTRR